MKFSKSKLRFLRQLDITSQFYLIILVLGLVKRSGILILLRNIRFLLININSRNKCVSV